MKRVFVFTYGAASYMLCLAMFVYAFGFMGNIGVEKSLDSPATDPFWMALAIDLGLLSVFAVQHSVMARPWFKRILTQYIPQPAERSTYVLASSLVTLLLFQQWRPMGGVVWDVQSEAGRAAFHAGYGLGWALLLFTTFVINHFDLFGIRQVWRHLQGQPQLKLRFVTPWLYRVVRHPLYVGWLMIFWSTPKMTAAHLVFAMATSAYIVLAIQFEEHDLMEAHPEYAEYRKQVPMLVPGLPKEVEGVRAEEGSRA